MHFQDSYVRASGRVAVMLAAVALVIGSLPPILSAQPLPVSRLAYSAKFVCGTVALADSCQLPPGSTEWTVIEIHNPHDTTVTVMIKVIQDSPPMGIIVPPYPVTLPPNGALEIDCGDLPGFCTGPVRKGFVEILTQRQLKVVAIYKEGLFVPPPPPSAGVVVSPTSAYTSASAVTYSTAVACGDNTTPEGNTVRHESTIAVTNRGNTSVSVSILAAKPDQPPISLSPRFIQPNGYTEITCDQIPFAPPYTASVTIKHPDSGSGAVLAVQNTMQKYVFPAGHTGVAANGVIVPFPLPGAVTMSVVEIQPVPVR